MQIALQPLHPQDCNLFTPVAIRTLRHHMADGETSGSSIAPSMGTLSTPSTDVLEVQMQSFESCLLRPLPLCALDWRCSIVVIQTTGAR
eukprot:2535774-Prorocentrum_lima.AAC.1